MVLALLLTHLPFYVLADEVVAPGDPEPTPVVEDPVAPETSPEPSAEPQPETVETLAETPSESEVVAPTSEAGTQEAEIQTSEDAPTDTPSESTTPPDIDFSSVLLNNAVTVSGNALTLQNPTDPNLRVIIPAGTTITGAGWDGIFQAPSVVTDTSFAGYPSSTDSDVIQIGSSSVSLTLSSAATVYLPINNYDSGKTYTVSRVALGSSTASALTTISNSTCVETSTAGRYICPFTTTSFSMFYATGASAAVTVPTESPEITLVNPTDANIQLVIPAGTVITADGVWDGTLQGPQILAPGDSGYLDNGSDIIFAGSPGAKLTLDRAADLRVPIKNHDFDKRPYHVFHISSGGATPEKLGLCSNTYINAQWYCDVSITELGYFYALGSAAPVLSEVTPVANPTSDPTPDYTFNSTEAGTIEYGGACAEMTVGATFHISGDSVLRAGSASSGGNRSRFSYSDILRQAVAGTNTITFPPLPDGAYDDCAIIVTDADGQSSAPLIVSPFTIATAPQSEEPQAQPLPSAVADPTAPVVTGGGGGTSLPSINISSNEETGFSAIQIVTVNGAQKYSGPVQLDKEAFTVDEEPGTKSASLTEDGTLVLKPNKQSEITLTIPPHTRVQGSLNWRRRIEPPLIKKVSDLVGPDGIVIAIADSEKQIKRDDIAIIVKAGSKESSLNFSNPIRFSVPLNLPRGTAVDIYFSPDGKTWNQQGPGVVEDEHLIIETDHLSYFAVSPTPQKVAVMPPPEMVQTETATPDDRPLAKKTPVRTAAPSSRVAAVPVKPLHSALIRKLASRMNEAIKFNSRLMYYVEDLLTKIKL